MTKDLTLATRCMYENVQRLTVFLRYPLVAIQLKQDRPNIWPIIKFMWRLITPWTVVYVSE